MQRSPARHPVVLEQLYTRNFIKINLQKNSTGSTITPYVPLFSSESPWLDIGFGLVVSVWPIAAVQPDTDVALT